MKEKTDKTCRICKKEPKQGFNIKSKLVSICEECERAIVKQSIIYKYTKSRD